jgi:hypothetical protein
LRLFSKGEELAVDLIADRALRAMLKNENGIGFGPLQKLFEIVFLS